MWALYVYHVYYLDWNFRFNCQKVIKNEISLTDIILALKPLASYLKKVQIF